AQRAEQRRLATSGRTEDADELTLANRQAHVAQNRFAGLVPGGQVLHLDERRSRRLFRRLHLDLHHTPTATVRRPFRLERHRNTRRSNTARTPYSMKPMMSRKMTNQTMTRGRSKRLKARLNCCPMPDWTEKISATIRTFQPRAWELRIAEKRNGAMWGSTTCRMTDMRDIR